MLALVASVRDFFAAAQVVNAVTNTGMTKAKPQDILGHCGDR
jgi:hypothetical protein